jgi:chromosome segregation protein
VAIESAEEKRKADIQQTEKELGTIQKKQSDHNRQLDSRRNEFKLTKSMVESLEGFPESIKFLSQDKEWAKRCPLLSDLIYVREEYRVVIENYLENYLNYYVVPDADEAVKAISCSEKARRGAPTFSSSTPLTTTKCRSCCREAACVPLNWWKQILSTGILSNICLVM